MPFALLIIGAVFLVSAVKGTTDGPAGLYALLVGDFTGQGNFVYWVAAILIIGALGYIPKAKPVSVALLGLVLVVLFLAKGDPSKFAGAGFFEKFTQGLASTQGTTPAMAPKAAPGQNPPGFNQPGSIINDPLGSLTPINNLVN